MIRVLFVRVTQLMALVTSSQIQPALACASCSTTLNADWTSQGVHTAAGLRLDLRHDYFNQDQLRSGTHKISRNALQLPNATDVALNTVSHNTLLDLDYSASRSWGLHVHLPYSTRTHHTVAAGDTQLSHSRSSGVGDMRITMRYQRVSADHGYGMQAGLKLPTGSSNVRFRSGPQQGELLNRSLQPGTGTTDVLLGVYHFGTLGDHLGYSTQALWQQPVNSHAGFRPGAAINLNAGLRYLYLPYVEPQLQVSVRIEGRESGAAATRANSGATFAEVSPGAMVYASLHWQVYGFVQVPIYQRVNGLQLAASRRYSVGVHYAF